MLLIEPYGLNIHPDLVSTAIDQILSQFDPQWNQCSKLVFLKGSFKGNS